MCLTGAVPAGAATQAGPPLISAPEAIVLDGWSGSVLFARNANVPRYPGSTVKIMTALVLLRHGVKLDRVVTVSDLAASYGGSTAGLYAGEPMTIRNLLYGMLLPSGNDAAIALSQVLAPTPQAFADLMNAQAVRLRLSHTHFLSPNGFDMQGQVSTAHDLALMAIAAMHWNIFKRIVRTRVWTARSADGRSVHTWTNLNQLLSLSASVDGVKTGTTPDAGACLVSSARKNGEWIVAVNLGSTVATRFSDGMALLNYGFSRDSGLPWTG
jgi:D-alanyl-D-alanine carboxypeptidase (penicillin-binding protein 5/6)